MQHDANIIDRVIGMIPSTPRWMISVVVTVFFVLSARLVLRKLGGRPVSLPTHEEAPPLSLTSDEYTRVMSGEVVTRSVRNKSGGANHGSVSQVVNASPSDVWRCLLDFRRYPDMVHDVFEVDVYHEHLNEFRVAVCVRKSFVSLTTYLIHTYDPDRERAHGTWMPAFAVLDESRSVGCSSCWTVRSLVQYSIKVRLQGWIPGLSTIMSPAQESYVLRRG